MHVRVTAPLVVLALSSAPAVALAAAGFESRAPTAAEREAATLYLQSTAPAAGAGALALESAALDVWRDRSARRDAWQFALTVWTVPTRGDQGVCHATRQRHERAPRAGAWTLASTADAVWLARGPRCDVDAHRVFLDTKLDDATVSLVLRGDQRLLDRSRALIQGAESCGNAWRCEMELARIAHPWILGPWRPDDL